MSFRIVRCLLSYPWGLTRLASNTPARPLMFQAYSWSRVHLEAQAPANVSYLVPEDDANRSGVSALSMTGARSG